MVEAKSISNNKKLSALERMNKEDEITEWLEKIGFIDSQQTSATLVDAGFSPAEFENIKGDLNKDAFFQVINWLENLLSSQKILKDMKKPQPGYLL